MSLKFIVLNRIKKSRDKRGVKYYLNGLSEECGISTYWPTHLPVWIAIDGEQVFQADGRDAAEVIGIRHFIVELLDACRKQNRGRQTVIRN